MSQQALRDTLEVNNASGIFWYFADELDELAIDVQDVTMQCGHPSDEPLRVQCLGCTYNGEVVTLSGGLDKDQSLAVIWALNRDYNVTLQTPTTEMAQDLVDGLIQSMLGNTTTKEAFYVESKFKIRGTEFAMNISEEGLYITNPTNGFLLRLLPDCVEVGSLTEIQPDGVWNASYHIDIIPKTPDNELLTEPEAGYLTKLV